MSDHALRLASCLDRKIYGGRVAMPAGVTSFEELTMDPALDIDSIEERANMATAGPWRRVGPTETAGWGVCVSAPWVIVARIPGRDKHTKDADQGFIAHAREDVPALIAEVRRLRAMLGSAPCR